jgi:hypothetical protein
MLFRLYYTAKTSQDEEITFDLSRSQSLTPFGIIMLTATISECQNQGKLCHYVPPKNQRLRRTLKDSGFDRYFGLNGKNRKPDRISTDRVQLRRIKGLNPLIIEDITEMLDYHLNISRGLKWVLHMSLSETMQNVVDHSGVDDYYVCATYFRRRREIRLCIADLGRGIPSSLRNGETRIPFSNDYEAIRLATDIGISCRSRRDGLGLNHIREFLAVNKGQMCIISENGKVFWKFDQGKILRQKMAQPFSGTAIKLVINTSRAWRYFLSDEKQYLF